MDKIKDYLPDAEIVAQLAEEASELTQAALKLRRVLDGTNPTLVALKSDGLDGSWREWIEMKINAWNF